MSKKRNGVHWSKSVPARSRRARALARLEPRLLTEKDEKKLGRMKKEIETLKSRL